MHIEDQEQAKRCGHRPNKATVSTDEMCDRLKAAVDARADPAFVIMARTDAFAREGVDASLERAAAYVEAGADMIFAEALYTLDDYRAFTRAIGVPVLANLTEFGLTPYFTVRRARRGGRQADPVSADGVSRDEPRGARVYTAMREQGTQRAVVEKMQTREELYTVLDYHAYERKLDELYARSPTAANEAREPPRAKREARRNTAKSRKGKRR